ncbi:MAG: hypothetical protein AAGD05_00420 [Bacteroidota bacterium]
MSILKKWQAQLHDRFLDKQSRLLHRPKQSISFAEAQLIGILFEATAPAERKIALDYAETLKQKGKTVKLLAFLDEAEQQANFTFKHFSRKELDWLLRPKATQVDEFINTPFDYLINLYQSRKKPLEFISVLSKAHLRVGTYPAEKDCFDLMIETRAEHNLPHFVKQLDYFLKKMNSNQQHEGAII